MRKLYHDIIFTKQLSPPTPPKNALIGLKLFSYHSIETRWKFGRTHFFGIIFITFFIYYIIVITVVVVIVITVITIIIITMIKRNIEKK